MPLVELDPNELRLTAERLERRISERFPGSGLSQRAVDLQDLLDRLRARADEVAEPIAWVRALYVVLAVVVIIGLTAVPIDLSATEELTTVGWVQFVEALVNDLVLLGAGIAFLTTLETRIKRRRALRELHEIRSFAHVIDMMQLTKDPQHLVDTPELRTEASPTNDLDAYELGRYLDYCSELLAVSAKGAAMIAQRFDDPAVLAAVNELENLTTGLSRKIWQKLMVLAAAHPEAAGGQPSTKATDSRNSDSQTPSS
ncbi:MAG: hypothetical protein AAF962_02795 [Actinomycetota bacterium]